MVQILITFFKELFLMENEKIDKELKLAVLLTLLAAIIYFSVAGCVNSRLFFKDDKGHEIQVETEHTVEMPDLPYLQPYEKKEFPRALDQAN